MHIERVLRTGGLGARIACPYLRTKRALAALVLALAAGGCVGPMNATVQLKTWTARSRTGWSGRRCTWRCTVIPVYCLFFVADILVFNSIEFWGRENPVDLIVPGRIEDAEAMQPAR